MTDGDRFPAQLFLLVLTGSVGGSATVAQILANDELGIRDLTLDRRRSGPISSPSSSEWPE